MRKLTIIGATLITIIALSAIASTMANAAFPEFNPKAIKNLPPFTSFSGKGTLQVEGGDTIVCESDTNDGVITGAKTVSLDIDFRTCTIFGIAGAHSLGDPEDTILVAATGELCYLNEAKEVGLIITPTGELHIEDPSAGALAEIEGSVIGQITPVNTSSLRFELLLKQESGKQAFKECGGKAAEFKLSENEGAFKKAGLGTTDAIGFLKEEVEVLA
jgi:hypothetical protein